MIGVCEGCDFARVCPTRHLMDNTAYLCVVIGQSAAVTVVQNESALPTSITVQLQYDRYIWMTFVPPVPTDHRRFCESVVCPWHSAFEERPAVIETPGPLNL